MVFVPLEDPFIEKMRRRSRVGFTVKEPRRKELRVSYESTWKTYEYIIRGYSVVDNDGKLFYRIN